MTTASTLGVELSKKSWPYAPIPSAGMGPLLWLDAADPVASPNTLQSPVSTPSTGVRAWFDGKDATSIQINGQNTIDQWLDKSGNNFHLTASTANGASSAPTPFAPSSGYVTFGGASNRCFNFPGQALAQPIGNYYTLFFVINPDPTKRTFLMGQIGKCILGLGASVVLNGGTDPNAVLGTLYWTATNDNSNPTFASSVPISAGPQIWSIVVQPFYYGNLHDSGDLAFYVNGTLKTFAANSYFNITPGANIPSTIGDQFGPGGYYYNNGNGSSSIGEMIFYSYTPFMNDNNNTYPTGDSNRQQVEGYLAWKWGLQASLPSGHPYISTPPTYTYLGTVYSWAPVIRPNYATTVNDKSGLGATATPNVPMPISPTGINGRRAFAPTGTQWLTGNLPGFNNGYAAYNAWGLTNAGYPGNSDSFPSYIYALNAKGLTAFIVYSMTSGTSANSRIVSLGYTGADDTSSTDYLAITRNGTGTNPGISAVRSSTTLAASSTDGTPALASIWYDGVNGNITSNAAITPTSGSSTVAFAPVNFAIGQNVNTSNQNFAFTGFIGEVLVFNYSLTSLQRQQVEGYLMQKWGLASSIPVLHPYNNIPILNRGFTPPDILGCQLWLDAADPATIVQPTTYLTQWKDKSGFGNHASTSGTSYVWGPNGNGLTFITGGDYPGLTGSISNISSKVTFFVVYSFTGDYSSHAWTSLRFSGPSYDLYIGIRGVGSSSGNAGGASAIATNILGIGSTDGIVITGSSNGPEYNQTANQLYTPFSSAPTSYSVCAGGDSNFSGNVSEVIVYDSFLPPAQKQQVTAYLAWKWKLISNITAGQPARYLPAYSPVFHPKTISGLQLWLDGADSSSMTFSGSNVTVWNDKSGNGNNGTATGTPTLSQNKLNDKSMISLDGSSYFLGSMSDTNTTLTAFFIGITHVSQSVNARVVSLGTTSANDYSSSSRCVAIYHPASSVGTYRNPSQSLASITLDQPYIACSLYDGTNGYTFLNGSASGSSFASTGSFNISAYGVGNYVNAPTNNEAFTGFMGEILVYNTALTASQRRKVEGYLSWKWGVQSILPTTHAWTKNSP